MARHAVLPALAALVLVLGSGDALAAGGKGQAIFKAKCAGCHTIGGGDTVGPDLKGVGERRGRSWIERFVAAPDKVIASGDPTAKELLAKYKIAMPNLALTQAEVTALVDFLTGGTAPGPTTTTTSTTPTSTVPQPSARGDAAGGKDLFTGVTQLGNGGPPCLSCHSIAGIGSLGGGTLGPDLTGAYQKYGGTQGLGSVLETLPFPTMAPIFSRDPLTAGERDDLVAFVRNAQYARRPAQAIGKLVGFSAAAVALLAALGLGIWRRRLTGVRIPLVNRSRGK